MALREISSSVDYIKWSDLGEGGTIAGYYMESKPSQKYPENMNHYIETESGQKYGLNGNANIDRALEQVKQGWYIQITYLGKKVLESGNRKGSECHQFKIAVDDERVHTLFGGNPADRTGIEYTNSELDQSQQTPKAAANAAPAMVPPTAANAPAQPAPAPAQEAPAAAAAPAPTPAPQPASAPAGAPAKKRDIF